MILLHLSNVELVVAENLIQIVLQNIKKYVKKSFKKKENNLMYKSKELYLKIKLNL
jgi:hypothetical protein